jgi:hypothetical protein
MWLTACQLVPPMEKRGFLGASNIFRRVFGPLSHQKRNALQFQRPERLKTRPAVPSQPGPRLALVVAAEDLRDGALFENGPDRICERLGH